MKWILIAVGAIVALVLVAVAIGALLPKSHVAQRSAVFAQPPERIWAVITDFAGQASWRRDITSVEPAGERNGKPVWREVSTRGETVPYETTELDPPRRLVRTIADPSLPYGGRWVYDLAATPGGTRLTITEEGEVYNPIFRLVSRFMDMRATMDRYLVALGEHLGEKVALQ
jgi:uncharacterized protein YndB with AHSA1/START domain